MVPQKQCQTWKYSLDSFIYHFLGSTVGWALKQSRSPSHVPVSLSI